MRKSNHWFWYAASAVGVCLTIAFLLPHILQRLDTTYSFQGIEIMPGDQEHYYAARVREVADGEWKAANPYFSEPKDQPYLQPSLPEWTIAMFGTVTGIGPVYAFVLSKAIFAFLLLIVMTGFLLTLTDRPWHSLLAASALLFAGSALSAPWDIVRFLTDSGFHYDILRFSRPVNPQWPTFWFFVGLWSLTAWFRDRQLWKVAVIGISLTAMLYSYVYAWTYFGVILSLLFLWFFVRRDTRRCFDLIIVVLITAILGIPYLMNLWELLHHPWYADTAMRQGLSAMRVPITGVWVLVFLVGSFLSRWSFPTVWPLLPVMALGGLISLNQQLITGMYLVPHHYHWYFIFPLAAIVTIVLFLRLSEMGMTAKKLKRVTYSVSLLAIISFGFLQQWKAYSVYNKTWGDRQENALLLHELEMLGGPGTVVYASENSLIREFIPIYTSLDVYAAGNAFLSLTSVERARELFFFDLWVSGMTPDEARARFTTDLRWMVGSRLYGIYHRERYGDYNLVPDEIIIENINAYERYFSLSLHEKLELYPIDLVVIVPEDLGLLAFDQIKELGTMLYEQGGYAIISL